MERIEDGATFTHNLSKLRDRARYVLLGEPGSGKSTALQREAAAAGSKTVRAREFAKGTCPSGDTVFIDALEEYRIGEPGIERLETLIDALERSGKARWRIACRAISLPPGDAMRIAEACGDFATVQLEPLTHEQQLEILELQEPGSGRSLMEDVSRSGGAALLGNPSTLLLLRETWARKDAPIETRGGLLAEATRQMAYEVNELMPERKERASAGAITAAAERTCLMLMLSDRSDIWMHQVRPPDGLYLTRDDVIRAHVDPQALASALDTAMFAGDGSSYIPVHRFVAEYLAGRSLAEAVVPHDPAIAALPLRRAVALLTGDDDRPVPALSGVFAWFVTMLSRSAFAEQALDLVRQEPEAVLFHGDAALLPPPHRRVLLDNIGRTDPWFLAGNAGSTGIAGLAGPDLAVAMRAILTNDGETEARRLLVLMALADGNPVHELHDVVGAIFRDEQSQGRFDRRHALSAYANVRGGGKAAYRAMLEEIQHQGSQEGLQLRLELLGYLAPEVSPQELRETIEQYGRSGQGATGYAYNLAQKLKGQPLPSLFDAPISVNRSGGQARFYEVASLIDTALAAAIENTGNLSPQRIHTWLSNVGIEEMCEPDFKVRTAVGAWLDRDEGHAEAFFDRIVEMTDVDDFWRVRADFQRLTGREPSDLICDNSLERVADLAAETGPGGRKAFEAAILVAHSLLRPTDRHEDRVWRLYELLAATGRHERLMHNLICCEVPLSATTMTANRMEREAETVDRQEEARSWYRDNIASVQRGEPTGLYYAGLLYLGNIEPDGVTGWQKLNNWIGDKAILDAIQTGLDRWSETQFFTPFEAGERAAGRTFEQLDLTLVAWADRHLETGSGLDADPATLLVIADRCDVLPKDRQDRVRTAALGAVLSEPSAAEILLAFWRGGLEAEASSLLLSHHLDPKNPAVGMALSRLLGEAVELPQYVLREALELAIDALPHDDIVRLAATSLQGEIGSGARLVWTYVAWALNPVIGGAPFQSAFAALTDRETFFYLDSGKLANLEPLVPEQWLDRWALIVRHFGPTYAPPGIPKAPASDASNHIKAVAQALGRLPTSNASIALKSLIDDPALAAWQETLQQIHQSQLTIRRKAEFRPPAPAQVALALRAGPPATAGDLRAIIAQTLEELGHHIRHGDTSPWKGFWNRPSKKKECQPKPSPKIENDCRDLLTDRLADRLARYGIPAKRINTEARSENDRRADAMILLGDGAAAVPIEAKRHWHKDLWTAIEGQLVPYCRSADSNGHGVYLVFWFGAWEPTPPNPRGPKPTTAAELRAALADNLPEELQGKIAIVVLDVSEPSITAAGQKS